VAVIGAATFLFERDLGAGASSGARALDEGNGDCVLDGGNRSICTN